MYTSTANFITLPGSEILLEDPETVRIQQGNTLNRGIMSVAQVMKELQANQGKAYFGGSLLTKLIQ